MDLLLSSQVENAEENQPITNLKPLTFSNTTVTRKMLSFHQKIAFLLKFVWCKRNDLTNNQPSIFLSVADLLTIPNLSFRGQRELFTGLQLHQKDQNNTAISYCCLTRSQLGAKGAVIPSILDCKYSNVEKKFIWPRKTTYSIHQAVDS